MTRLKTDSVLRELLADLGVDADDDSATLTELDAVGRYAIQRVLTELAGPWPVGVLESLLTVGDLYYFLDKRLSLT